MNHQEPHAQSQRKLPDEGKFLIDDWCAIGDCCRKSVLRTIKDFNIDVIDTPGMMVIVAEWWWYGVSRGVLGVAGPSGKPTA